MNGAVPEQIGRFRLSGKKYVSSKSDFTLHLHACEYTDYFEDVQC
jgi:hypothetical protein